MNDHGHRDDQGQGGPDRSGSQWYDNEAGPLVRPYAMTGGRTSPGPRGVRFDLISLVKLDEAAFGSAKSISIDYAVMEKTARAAVVPVACGWSDVGSWHAVWELSGKDGDGNATTSIATMLKEGGTWRLAKESTTSHAS